MILPMTSALGRFFALTTVTAKLACTILSSGAPQMPPASHPGVRNTNVTSDSIRRGKMRWERGVRHLTQACFRQQPPWFVCMCACVCGPWRAAAHPRPFLSLVLVVDEVSGLPLFNNDTTIISSSSLIVIILEGSRPNKGTTGTSRPRRGTIDRRPTSFAGQQGHTLPSAGNETRASFGGAKKRV